MIRFLRRRWKWLLGASLIPAMAWLLLPRPALYPEDLTWSRAVLDRHGRLVHISTTADHRYRLRTALEEISPHWIEATLVKEDRWFRRHPGVNPVSALRAAWGMLRGEPSGGASTITMQLARLRWDIDSRSVPGKLHQMARAIQLERHYGKDQILEAYLNLAPYGGNVEGAGAAAWLWCGRPATEVTPREAIALSIIPQSPSTRHPGRTSSGGRIARAQALLAGQLEQHGGLRPDPLASDFTLNPAGPPPHDAPHFCRRLLQSTPQDQIRSTLDLALQHQLEAGISRHIGRTAELGIHNACAILVHAPSREILAYVGSADYGSAEIQGMVDGIRARRSPGSAVKPFVYGLALDHGLIHPRSLLADEPMRISEYQPENYEGDFLGPVHADEALARSRNIPAVDLANRLPDGGLYTFLQRAGVGLPHPRGHYGLALTLGGFGISPEQLAGLYAALADDGLARPLVDQASSSSQVAEADGTPLLSAQARFLIRDMLRKAGELGIDGGRSRHDPTVAYKTGTSHGFRDAWAAGIRGDHVLVVWLGNFDGRGNNSLVARRCAVPLLFDLFARLPLPDASVQPPTGLRQVKLCALSGDLPGPSCPQHSSGWFIPQVSPISICSIHREILVDAESGLRVARDDGRPGLRREVHEFWSPDMLELFRLAGLPRRQPPAPEHGTDQLAGINHGSAPKITSPLMQRIYRLDATLGSGEIPLKAEAAPGVGRIYWFAGRAFLGSSPPDSELAWSPPAGQHQLRAIDDHGRSSEITLRVTR